MAEAALFTPEWWVERLSDRLDRRQDTTEKLRKYYTGDHPLPVGDERSRAEFKILQAKSRSNWCGLVANAVKQRIRVDGFRLGGADEVDAEAWRLWQANSLDADFDHVLTEALSTRHGFMMVWPNPADSSTPLITVESADQVIVEYVPGSHRVRAAALKVWWDDWYGQKNANLFLPDGLYKFTKTDRGWAPRLVEGETWPLANPFADGRIPVVEFVNRQTLHGGGLAEFEDVLDIQDRVNETLFNRMIAVRTAAFKQKWVTGLEVPTDDDGNPIQLFESDVTKLWWSEDPDTKFGEFSESNISGYNSAVEQDIQHMASITSTPPHYLLGQSGAFPSGDSLKATETGLVAKVKDRQRYFGEDLEEVMRLAFMAAGRASEAANTSLETVWADPESRSLAEVTDSVMKQQALGVPRVVLWEKLGYSPAEIARMKDLSLQESQEAFSLGLADTTPDDGAVAA